MRDRQNDLALLPVTEPPRADLRLQRANWRLSVRLGEDVVVYGFPLAGVLSSEGNVTTGIITALSGTGDNKDHLQLSAPVQPGNSGGPVLDRQGNVVGVVVSKLNDLAMVAAKGDLPQN